MVSHNKADIPEGGFGKAPYFHKEISHKYETSRDDIVKKSSFFFVKKSDDNVSTVRINEMECVTNESGIENVSPVKNSYDALWCEYRDARLPATLLSVIQRIVEYYFLQLCSYSIEDLRERVKTHIGGDDKKQRIADEILRFIYDEKFDTGDIGQGDADREKKVIHVCHKYLNLDDKDVPQGYGTLPQAWLRYGIAQESDSGA